MQDLQSLIQSLRSVRHFAHLPDLDLQAIPSQANFVAIIAPPLGAARLTELLLQRGFIVRELTTFGMKNAIRVSVGTMEENMAFAQTLKLVFETEGVAA